MNAIARLTPAPAPVPALCRAAPAPDAPPQTLAAAIWIATGLGPDEAADALREAMNASLPFGVGLTLSLILDGLEDYDR